ncbi:E3 ubiquitin-protein ligase TRIM17-like [Vombatus ursinus]|uniref:E3 ubiquitin-protein ligase TRIM17-like n=1 Tax=Vombatus ursinus TaxID=29139 RepID=UPI000FFD8718|nr:E3 ubiquitin-protein ligase TRIM17-like [Vombatus ursinus]
MASFPELIENFQEELICSICRDYLENPMSIECGHSFCHSCLLRSWQQASLSFSCPECRSVSQVRTFKANVRHRKFPFNRQHQQYPEELRKCERHQEAQKLFCMDDQIFLCMSCSKSQEHEAHKICPLEEAAEDYRKRLQDNLKCLDENLKDVKKLILEEKMVPRTWAVVWTEQVDMSREELQEKFQEISEFLSDEEEDVHNLVELDEEESEMFEKLKDHEAQEEIKNFQKKNRSRFQMSRHSKDLSEMVTALEEKSQMSDGDLLQDIGDTLSRTESLLLQRPEPFTPKLSNSYCMSLNKFLKKFQGSRLLACHYPYELSDDRKRTFTFANISSGQTYVVYTSGSIHYMSGRELSITPLDMDTISEEKQVPPISACYCLPIERNILPADLESQ